MKEIPERVYLSTDRQWAKSQTPICTEEYVRAPALRERDYHAPSTVHHALLQHAHLYMNNAAFKLSVDTLIPLMIDALAMKAERDWAKHERLVKEIMEARVSWTVPEGALDDFDPDEGFNPATGQPR